MSQIDALMGGHADDAVALTGSASADNKIVAIDPFGVFEITHPAPTPSKTIHSLASHEGHRVRYPQTELSSQA